MQHAHCSHCGAGFPADAGWPRTCAGCGETTWSNPLPVAVVLLPVGQPSGTTGLVVIRRDIEPARGELAFPGGFIETGESWREAAVRELSEETGLSAKAQDVSLFGVDSSVGGNTINVFALLPVVSAADLPISTPTPESTEFLVLWQPTPLAFPTHTQAMAAYFAGDRAVAS